MNAHTRRDLERLEAGLWNLHAEACRLGVLARGLPEDDVVRRRDILSWLETVARISMESLALAWESGEAEEGKPCW